MNLSKEKQAALRSTVADHLHCYRENGNPGDPKFWSGKDFVVGFKESFFLVDRETYVAEWDRQCLLARKKTFAKVAK